MKTTTARSLVTGTLGLAVTIATVVTSRGLAGQGTPTLVESALQRDFPTIVDTSITLVGTLLALLAFGRYRRSRRRGDLYIAAAVALLAWTYTLFEIVPDAISPYSVGNGVSERVESWGMVVVKIVAAWYLVVAAAARSSSSSPRSPTRLGRSRGLLVPAGAGVVALTFLVWLAPIGGGGLLHNVSWPLSLPPILELLGASLFFVSFVWLSRRAATGSDSFVGWIAAGCAFAGFSMITVALAPAGKVGWLHSGDLLRGAAVGTWAIGAVTEIFSYWSRIAEAVRTETRRSLALDLHDGLAQELALLATYTYAPAEARAEPQWHEQVDATAARALAEARRAIITLTGEAVPFQADVERTVEWISRSDVDIRVEIDAGVAATATDLMQREYLVRIVREAVTNAIRHGSARHIDVVFEAGASPRLAVFDDGVGFDPAREASIGRLGLVSMRERAEAIGASLAVRSVPGQGTTVEVLWP